MEIEKTILEIFKNISGKDDITADMDITEEIGLESIEILQCIGLIEKEYNVKISSRELRNVFTIEEMAKLVEEKLGK